MCAEIRKRIDCGSGSLEAIDFHKESTGDVMKQIQTADGRSFFERSMRGDKDLIPNAHIWYNCSQFIKNDMDLKLKARDRVIILGWRII